MKKILLLCLISLFSCNLLDIGQCLMSKPKIQELVLKVLSYNSTKDYSKMFSTIVSSLPDAFKDAIDCLSKPKDEETEDVTLKIPYCNDRKGFALCLNRHINDLYNNGYDFCYDEYCLSNG